MKETDIRDLFFAFLNRERFKYNVGSILEYAIKCLCIRSIGDKRRSHSYKKHFLFRKAEEKFA